MNYLKNTYSYSDTADGIALAEEFIVPQQEGQFDLVLEVNGSDPNLFSVIKYRLQVST